jgi:hypothetical protein
LKSQHGLKGGFVYDVTNGTTAVDDLIGWAGWIAGKG